LKKCAVMCTRAGRKYVLVRAETRSMSLRIFATSAGARARVTTRMYRRVLEIGMVDKWRIRSGIGRDGVVVNTDGMPRRRVEAFRTGMAIEETGVDASVSGLFGLAENKIRGRVRSTATSTDRMDKILNDRVLEDLAVVIG